MIPTPLTPSQAAPAIQAPDHLVTASELVRHFGVWQEKAARNPVYILHRGRPRHVLTSVEVMEALCATRTIADAPARAEAVAFETLLDLTRDVVLVAAADRRLLAASLPARTLFGGETRSSVALESLFAPAIGPLLIDAIDRVARCGIPEMLDVTAIRYPDRQLEATITPMGTGIALRLADATLADELAVARAAIRADDAALAAATGIATATINLRGFLGTASASLSRLTRLAADSLANARFVSLFDVGARPAVGEAIEQVIASGESAGLTAQLLVNRANPAPVRLGLAPFRDGRAVAGVRAVIAVDGANRPQPLP